MEEEQQQPIEFIALKKNKLFWLYLLGASLVAVGYADFALIAYHFAKIKLLTPVWIPISYAISLGGNIVAAPLIGHLYDRHGFRILVVVTAAASFFPWLTFLGNANAAIAGVVLWGIGFGAQGSLMRAIVGNMVSKEKRATAYGVFNAFFGLSWFIGSAIMGILYDSSILAVVVFSTLAQWLSIPILWKTMHLLKRG